MLFRSAYHAYGDSHDEQGNGPFNLNVAVAVCTAFGQSVPRGRLPVDVPRRTAGGGYGAEVLYPRGSGLQNWG